MKRAALALAVLSALPLPSSAQTFTSFAPEDSLFHVQEQVYVRFCSLAEPGKCLRQRLVGDQSCDTDVFQGDPDPGRAKHCLLSSGVRAPGIARLDWLRSPTFGGVYRVYVGEASGQYISNYSAGAGTSWALVGILGPKTLYLAVTAVDPVTGEESIYSNEVSKTFPAPAP